ncbi:uncharacterized protein LOC132740250 [Ruditapes philippinarum]|uniref:uncharacterized protein LOC132740250 n=1 Tax=Ruditapes philippinarum TaxID=129788 RepID=UPI00295AC9D5|nr:uncharacterized protein LOC132740250 [Ruditapes philippinarum]
MSTVNFNMAKNRGKSEYENRRGLTQPTLPLSLRNYDGPYNRSALLSAHATLLYHVEQVQSTTAWRRIQMKTPINVNGVTDSDDGFGAASNVYSHSGLPETEEFIEPCHDHPEEKNESSYISGTVDTQEKTEIPCSSSAYDQNISDDKNYIEKKINWKEMEKITIKVNVQRQSTERSDCSKVVKKDLFLGESYAKDGHEKKTLEQRGIRRNIDENITEFTKINSKGGNENRTLEQYIEDGISGEIVNETYKTQITSKQSVQQILKCDFCDYRCTDLNDIEEHLQSVMHYSASRCDIDNAGEVVLKEKMISKNEKAKFKTAVMKCPSNICCTIFHEMSQCISHYNEKHWKMGAPRSQFALADIVKVDECSIVLKPPKCQLCSLELRSKSHMKKHLIEKHLPLRDSFSKCKNKFILFCIDCEKSYSWIDEVISHLRKHKPSMHEVSTFNIFQIDNVRKFHISHTGTINKIGGDSDATVGSGKRAHDLTFSSNEPNLKITRKMESSSREVALDNETDKLQVAKDEQQVARHKQTLTGTDSCDSVSNILVEAKASGMDISLQTGSSVQQETLKDVFSCDYCQELTDSEKQIMSHLNERCHSSASSVLIDSDKNVKYIKRLSSMSRVGRSHQKLYATCTKNCHILFKSVKENIEHDVVFHHAVMKCKPCYGIVTVREEVVLKLSVKKCIVCGLSWDKTKPLLTHYKEQHMPFSSKEGCDIFFKCATCPKTFSRLKDSLHHAKTHIYAKDDHQFKLSVLYLDSERELRELPPKFSKNEKEREEKIKTLKNSIQELESKTMCEKKAKQLKKRALRKAKHKLLAILT